MATFVMVHIGFIPTICVTLKVVSTTCGTRTRTGTRARMQMFMIIRMIVLLLAIARAWFAIPILAIVLITEMASGTRATTILFICLLSWSLACALEQGLVPEGFL